MSRLMEVVLTVILMVPALAVLLVFVLWAVKDIPAPRNSDGGPVDAGDSGGD